MIDIAILRENPEAVKENMRKKFQHDRLHLVDEAYALDKEYDLLNYLKFLDH